MRPKLSVIVPSHDTRELTLRCLSSLAATGSGLEILLVDDASRDGTVEAVAARHPEVEVLRSAEPLGFTRAANLGLRRARGEILLLLNSDTEVAPDALERLLAAFARDPRLGAAGGLLHYPDGSPQWSGGRSPSVLWLFALASGLPALLGRLPLYRRAVRSGVEAAGPVDWVTGAALAVRRAALDEAGPFDEAFRFYGQDLDLCLRLREAGWTVAVLPEVRVLHHHGGTIGKDPGASGRQHPELLWSDLLRWARKQRSPRWARRAERALRWGARLRVLGRRLALPLVPPSRRPAWRGQTRAFVAGLAALSVRGSRLPGEDGVERRSP